MTTPDRAMNDFLERALARAEVSVAYTRLVIIALMVVEEVLFLARRPELARSFLGWMPMGVMAGGVGVTLLALRQLKRAPRAAFRVSVALDAVLILGVSLPPALSPPADYHGAFHHATFPFFLVAIAASSLRLSRRIVRLSIACNAAAGILLHVIDSAMGTGVASAEEWAIWVVAFTAAGFIADAAALRARRLVHEGASAAVLAERGRQALGIYVSEEVAAAAIAGDAPSPGGHRQAVAILFSDLRGFSAYAATVAPEKLVNELNAYLEAVVPAVRAEGGVVDKYIGDAVMVVFGVPTPVPDAASRALRAAVAMHRALAKHNESRRARGLPPLEQGVSVHFGEVVVGNIGTAERMQYTAVGDAVNVASRLQETARDEHVAIVVSAAVAEVIGTVEGVPPMRPLGAVAIRGRASPVNAYAIDRV
ncbi:MAG: adenylate/guanylate cyclase domain-containing protein [Deltaproteobacteria bacterium]|nr:adenylate/guanylate cyclase domain-containing protein [Deltaproteobacteria bacterium]